MRTLAQNIKRSEPKSIKELSGLTQDVLLRACAHGASDAAVVLNCDSGFSIDVRMGGVETVAFSEDNGIAITVYKGHKKGSASSTDMSSAALDVMVAAALDIAEVSAADPCFGLADRELINLDCLELDLYHPWELSTAMAIENALNCEHQALAMDKRIVNSDGVNVSTHNFCLNYANTHGFSGTVQSSRHSISCSLIAQDHSGMQRDYDYTVARDSSKLMSIESLAASAVARALSRLGARQIKTQESQVLFSSRVSAGLFASFINAISGSNLYRKNSFLFDSIGLQVFPSNLYIYDQPHLLGALGSAAFDNDGLKTRPNIWVKNGKVCQYVLNSYAARKLGLKTSANSGGVFNLSIDATAGNLAELIKTMGKGLLVTELMGDGVNVLTGDYSRGASGFWVEDGAIQYPVEEITIAGNLASMFKGIVAVGDDFNPNIATRCGSVLIERMMIAGN